MVAKYTNRERVIQDFRVVGVIAKFLDGTWRCSSHKDAERFATAEAAKRSLLSSKGK